MVTSESLKFALLPEGKVDRRALAVSYGSVLLLLFSLAIIQMIWPEHLFLHPRYQVTELIPAPNLEPEPVKIKPRPQPRVQPVPVPVSETPKLIVPREIRRSHPEQPEIAPPKVALNNFTSPVLPPSSSSAKMAQIVHTGEFGGTETPTLKAAAPQVETGGFGDPKG